MSSVLSYRAGPTDRALLDETIGGHFDRIASVHGEREGLVVKHQGIRWSYRQYQAYCERFAAGLLALGVRKGDRVGIWGPNSHEWAVTQMASAQMGAILVCINPAYRLSELEYALELAGCRALVTAAQFKSSDYLGMLQTLAPELHRCPPGRLRCRRLPELEIVVRMGEDATPGMLNFDTVHELGGAADLQRLSSLKLTLQPQDPINIQFTSGTTGRPKGATLTHFNILNNAKAVGDAMRLTPEDRLCIPVPLYHCFGMVMGNLACLTHGSTAVYPGAAFEAGAVLRTVEEEHCTALHGVPTMFIAELDHPDFPRVDLRSLRTGIMAGAPCPVAIMRRVMREMHMEEVLIAYGQTELSPVCCMTDVSDPIEKRVSSVGKAGPHLEVKIVDAQGRTLETGQAGEVCTRGYSVMRGYWQDAERTAEAIDAGGWLHSGDLAVMDEEGYVSIVGRIKDMIIRGGENIYPREIEEFLHTHPAIEDVQVFGVPDARFGEAVCAWIRVRGGAALTEDDVRMYCHDRIAHYKIPAHIRFVDEYPMTVTGKVQKYRMRELMASEAANSKPARNDEAV